MSDDHHLASLQGRIIALELLIDGLVTTWIMDRFGPDPDAVERARREMFDSHQHLERPTDPESDAIWSEAERSLNMRFDNVVKRVSHIAGR